ncbi:AMP-binding protein [Enterococcus sp. ALS3]|uniref:AMP-binding protein n=1 Tax=Enterococcus alishanensis TaxID=1303817 RepID=A0ABS6THX3_9ENTE|nr:AMP-binding protein [Enterococcus alishanensis]MBV7392470.1 AMP-binding protein [Enterococcus alishanensis]
MGFTIADLLNQYKKNNTNLLLNEKNLSITHLELEQYSNQFARVLMKIGVNKGDRIMISLSNKIFSVCVIFGILKVGAIFIPISEKKTKLQVTKIVEDIEPKVIIHEKKDSILQSTSENKTLINISSNADFFKLIEHISDNPLESKVISRDIAYIIYTSGTTGDPKGIMMSHGAILSYVYDVVDRFNHNSSDKTICRTPPSFDPYLTEILPSIVSGGEIYLQENNVSLNTLLSLISEKKITNFGCGPALLSLFIQAKDTLHKYKLNSLSEIYFGYEKMGKGLLSSMQSLLPNVTFINGYGTSESFAATTYHVCKKNEDITPIGTANNSSEVFLWNEEEKRVCKNNEFGEIIIRSSTLMNGYWKNSTATRKVLRRNPCFPESDELVYFTNDVGKYLNQQIVFIGRKDNEIKLNGIRINLDEIAELIYQLEDIKEAIVIKKDEELVCLYSTFSKEEKYVEIRNYLKKCLEPFKVPTKFLFQENFCRNENSKLIKSISQTDKI